MIFLFALLALSALHSSDFLIRISAWLAPSFHTLCLSLISGPPDHPLNSLICGASLPPGDLKELFRKSGLLHLFVVSGAHLVWLDQGLQKIRTPIGGRWLAWTLFALACGWQAPVVRGWLGLCLTMISLRWSPRLRPDQGVLVTGLFTLTLFPSWGTSLSCGLSWAAALALSLPTPSGWRGALVKCAWVWLFLLPLLMPWSPASPLTILSNFFLAPVFSFLLMPLGVISLPLPLLRPLFDGTFSLFVSLLRLLPEQEIPPISDQAPTPRLMWGWLIFLHVSLHAFLTLRKRQLS